jgi:AsmA protein
MSALNSMTIDGKLNVGSISYDKYRISGLNVGVKADGNQLTLSGLNVKVDSSQIKGSAGIKNFSKPLYTFDLNIDQLDADQYVAASPADKKASNKPTDLSALKALNADGTIRIGKFKYGKTNASNIVINLKADGQKLALNPFSAKVDDSQITANIGISQFSNPAYSFNLAVDKLDADRYIAKGGANEKSNSDTPIDLSALKKLNASGEAKIGWLKLANIKTSNVNIGLKASDGVATLSPFSANLYQGSMAGALTVDARATPSIQLKQNMKNVSINPLMVDAIKNDMLSGNGSVNIDISTQGNTVSALKKSLQGNAALSLADGALKGVDIAGSIRELKSKINILKNKEAASDQSKKTDFSELTASFTIKNGVAHNEDLAMKAPILRLAKGDSHGEIDIANEKINYIAKPTIVKSLKGQGGADLDSLAGVGIPLKISGSFADPKFGLDFASVGTALAKSNLLDKVGGEKGAAVKELLGSDNKVDALGNILNGKKKDAGTSQTNSTEAASPEQKPKSLEDQAKEKAEKKLKKLLKF